jgi:hypothetical protein
MREFIDVSIWNSRLTWDGWVFEGVVEASEKHKADA